jgi:hypothetical protein
MRQNDFRDGERIAAALSTVIDITAVAQQRLVEPNRLLPRRGTSSVATTHRARPKAGNARARWPDEVSDDSSSDDRRSRTGRGLHHRLCLRHDIRGRHPPGTAHHEADHYRPTISADQA